MILARGSSSFRRAVTLGWGMSLETWASISSAVMLRTWGVSFFPHFEVSFSVKGRSTRSPRYCFSRPSILLSCFW